MQFLKSEGNAHNLGSMVHLHVSFLKTTYRFKCGSLLVVCNY